MTDEAWIDTVRLARDLGTVQQLMPPGVTSLLDLPHVLFRAIKLALMFAGWDENLEDYERPPKRIWLDGRQLKAWFEQVRVNRRREAEGKSIEDPVANAAAEGLIVG